MRHAGLLRYHIPDISVSDATHIYAGTILPILLFLLALINYWADAPYIVLCGRIRAELLLQCVSRTLKNILRCIQRDWIKSQHSDVSEQAIRQILVQFLNLVSGAHSNSVSLTLWLIFVTF